jgi:hypothetical protein
MKKEYHRGRESQEKSGCSVMGTSGNDKRAIEKKTGLEAPPFERIMSIIL